MTVCGFVVTDQRTAFAWSDSETYLDGEPSGHVSKMAVNPLTGVVGVGAGIHVALIEAAGTMRLATGLDQVAALLPFTLCRVMEPKYWEARGLAALSADEGGSYGVVGWSAKFGRIVGYRFRTATRFAPELVHSFGSPHVAQILGLVSYAMEPADLVDAAIAQLEVVRGDIPAASGGVLTTAEIRAAGVTVRPLYDFATGRFLARPPALGTP